MVSRNLMQAMLLAGGLTACGSSSTPNSNTGADAGTTQDAGTVADAGTNVGADAGTTTSTSLNGCGDADYMDMSTGTASDRMVMIDQSGAFDMPCMTIAAGQGVEFMWNMSKYPLMPGAAPSQPSDQQGTSPNPIMSHNSGSLYTVTFPDKGLFPFYVQGYDSTLAGVIQVK